MGKLDARHNFPTCHKAGHKISYCTWLSLGGKAMAHSLECLQDNITLQVHQLLWQSHILESAAWFQSIPH